MIIISPQRAFHQLLCMAEALWQHAECTSVAEHVGYGFVQHLPGEEPAGKKEIVTEQSLIASVVQVSNIEHLLPELLMDTFLECASSWWFLAWKHQTKKNEIGLNFSSTM